MKKYFLFLLAALLFCCASACAQAPETELNLLTIGHLFKWSYDIQDVMDILETYEAVNEPNFSILFDTCHGYMSAVMGARHIEPDILEGGILEFIDKLKGKIGFVHLIDSDGTLNVTATSTHAPFGLGKINFDEVVPALLAAGYDGEWWAIDLCEWPDAWNAIRQCKEAVDGFNEKYCR